MAGAPPPGSIPRGNPNVRHFAESTGVPKGAVSARRRPGKAMGGLSLAAVLGLMSAPMLAAPPDASKTVKEVCAACHTESGNSAAPPFPRLSGMQPEYLSKQLRDIASGTRKSEIMAPIVSKLTRGEIEPLSNYFSAQKRTPGIVSNPALVSAGATLFLQGDPNRGIPACAGCHTPSGAGTVRFPMLASQNADYVAQQLQNFRSGARANDFGLLMRTVASRLTDEQIQAVSQYVASMPVVQAGR